MAEVPIFALIGQSNAARDELDSFVRSLLDEQLATFELVVFAVGGTPLALDENGPDWNAASEGDLFDQFIEYMNERAAHIVEQGHTPVFHSVLMVQGESDAFQYNRALQYKDNLTAFIQSSRAELNSPDLEFVLTNVHADYPRNGTSLVREAFYELDDEVENVRVVDSSALSTYDGVHYNIEARNTLSLLLVDAIEFQDNYAAVPEYQSLTSLHFIQGTETGELIEGDYRDDVINGLGGDDRIYANGGNNIIDGGAGNDRIRTGAGNDEIHGGDGNDVISSGTAETLDLASRDANFDNDRIFGGDGNDFIEDFGGSDLIDAGDGNDVIYARVGNDTIYGGRGNDKIFDELESDRHLAENVDDEIFAGRGNDYIRAWFGNDTIYGGLGDDTIVLGDPNREDLSANDSDIVFAGAGSDKIVAHQGNNTIYGGSGSDIINLATKGNNRAFGDDGNDVFYVGHGDNYIVGGAGRDTVFLTRGTTEVWTNSRNDAIRDGAGDTLAYLGSGNDFFDFGGGSDIVRGQLGNDTFRFSLKSSGAKQVLDWSDVDRLEFASGLDDYFIGLVDTGARGNTNTYRLDFSYDLSIYVESEQVLTDADLYFA